jgi:hypothetical protein
MVDTTPEESAINGVPAIIIRKEIIFIRIETLST